MFEVLISLFSWTKTALYYLFAGNLLIGKTLFNIIKVIALNSVNLLGSTICILEILFFDFGVFLKDVTDKVRFVFQFLYHCLDTILYYIHYNTIISGLSSVLEIVQKCVSNLSNFYSDLLIMIISGGTLLKKFMILLASGVWFAISIIPIGFMTGIILCNYCLEVLYEEVKDFLKSMVFGIIQGIQQMITFYMDLPLEATLGILVISTLVYGLYKFSNWNIFTARTLGKVQKLLKILAQRIIKLKKKKVHLKDTETSKQKAGDTTTCIICQEKQKCILILPCKHVCCCKDCSLSIQAYSSKCPLCRTEINNMVQVYL